MRKILTLSVILMICLGFNISSAANIKDYPRVAVMNFGNKAVMSGGLRETDFSAATEYAIYQLAASGWFDLIDYEELSAAAKMHSVNMSGLIDQTTAPAIGKFLGAQFMVIGNLTGLTTKENVVGYQHGKKGGLDTNEHVVTANVSMRIVDIETGRIVVAGLGKGSSTSSHTEVSFKKYRRKRNDSETTTVDLKARKTASETSTGGTGESYGADDGYPDEGMNGSSSTESENEATYKWTQTTNYEDEEHNYKVTIGTKEVADIQMRNAISKAVRDCIYGKMGLMTTLNGGKKLKIKTGF